MLEQGTNTPDDTAAGANNVLDGRQCKNPTSDPSCWPCILIAQISPSIKIPAPPAAATRKMSARNTIIAAVVVNTRRRAHVAFCPIPLVFDSKWSSANKNKTTTSLTVPHVKGTESISESTTAAMAARIVLRNHAISE